jgi:hypothetical protein
VAGDHVSISHGHLDRLVAEDRLRSWNGDGHHGRGVDVHQEAGRGTVGRLL